jgi:hypothetical protein
VDKDEYVRGESGYITVTIYNDARKEGKIRVTELAATFAYYYSGGTAYTQTFYTDAALPTEIQKGDSAGFFIPFSLPSDIASGYISINVRAETELWNPQLEVWLPSDSPTYVPLIYVESPYKEQMEEQVTINEQLEEQLEEQQMINRSTTNIMYISSLTAVVFAAMTAFLFFLNRRARVLRQPAA